MYLKEYEDALKYYNKFLDIDPDNGFAYFSL
jgi:tetratricopeptide (TPR) repeat protein